MHSSIDYSKNCFIPKIITLYNRPCAFQIDLSTTCYGDQSQTIGVVGDSDGSVIKTLRSVNSIPVALADTKMRMGNFVTIKNQHRLQLFIVVADSPQAFYLLMKKIMNSVWWNHYANFLVLAPTADSSHQCRKVEAFLYIAFREFGAINTQAICLDRESNVSIVNSNPFAERAPESWEFTGAIETNSGTFNFFNQPYREGAQACEALSFPKTLNLDGYPFRIKSQYHKFNVYLASKKGPPEGNVAFSIFYYNTRWLLYYIQMGLKAELIVSENPDTRIGMDIAPVYFSDFAARIHEYRTYPIIRQDMLAVTQHTGYMTQLEKIMSVIDRPSRIGVWIVYLITFMFFKFFQRQATMPSLLDLARLTSGQGLVKLPPNVAPTIYLACLFMFVVTLQGILTGNLATLLTTNIHYPNVNKRQDIADLGYTIYTNFDKFFGDSIFDGRLVAVDQNSGLDCIDYVRRDPLAVCVDTFSSAIIDAYSYRLHMSRDAIDSDYLVYTLTINNPLGRRLDSLFITSIEHGLRERDFDDYLTVMHINLQNDDVVNQNADRKVMDFSDLRFAFVILGIGLACSLVCFVGEIVVHRVHMKMAKRRARNRTRLAWLSPSKSMHIVRPGGYHG